MTPATIVRALNKALPTSVTMRRIPWSEDADPGLSFHRDGKALAMDVQFLQYGRKFSACVNVTTGTVDGGDWCMTHGTTTTDTAKIVADVLAALKA